MRARCAPSLWIPQSKYSSFHCQVWTGAKAFQPCLAKLVVHYVERVTLVPIWNQRENLSKIQAFDPWAKTYTTCIRSIPSRLTCIHVWKSMEAGTCTKDLHLRLKRKSHMSDWGFESVKALANMHSANYFLLLLFIYDMHVRLESYWGAKVPVTALNDCEPWDSPQDWLWMPQGHLSRPSRGPLDCSM